MQAFSTPKSREWSGVTAQQAVVNGNCPSIKCNYCDKVFAGNASRIRAHYLKCVEKLYPDDDEKQAKAMLGVPRPSW